MLNISLTNLTWISVIHINEALASAEEIYHPVSFLRFAPAFGSVDYALPSWVILHVVYLLKQSVVLLPKQRISSFVWLDFPAMFLLVTSSALSRSICPIASNCPIFLSGFVLRLTAETQSSWHIARQPCLSL